MFREQAILVYEKTGSYEYAESGLDVSISLVLITGLLPTTVREKVHTFCNEARSVYVACLGNLAFLILLINSTDRCILFHCCCFLVKVYIPCDTGCTTMTRRINADKKECNCFQNIALSL